MNNKEFNKEINKEFNKEINWLIAMARYAANDDTRIVSSNIKLNITEDSCHAIATNGFIMIRRKLSTLQNSFFSLFGAKSILLDASSLRVSFLKKFAPTTIIINSLDPSKLVLRQENKMILVGVTIDTIDYPNTDKFWKVKPEHVKDIGLNLSVVNDLILSLGVCSKTVKITFQGSNAPIKLMDLKGAFEAIIMPLQL